MPSLFGLAPDAVCQAGLSASLFISPGMSLKPTIALEIKSGKIVHGTNLTVALFSQPAHADRPNVPFFLPARPEVFFAALQVPSC